jgi:hypothetical protein
MLPAKPRIPANRFASERFGRQTAVVMIVSLDSTSRPVLTSVADDGGAAQ